MVQLLVLTADVGARLHAAAQTQRAAPLREPGRETDGEVGGLERPNVGLGDQGHDVTGTRAPGVDGTAVDHVAPFADLVVGDAPCVELGERRGGVGHDRGDDGIRWEAVTDQIEDGAGVRGVMALEEPDDEQLVDLRAARIEELERARSDVGGLVATEADVSPALERDADVGQNDLHATFDAT